MLVMRFAQMFSVCFRFSGVTAESLRGVTTTIHEVQAVLLSMIHRDTILVGHSLESDLKATKVPCTNYITWGIQKRRQKTLDDFCLGLLE